MSGFLRKWVAELLIAVLCMAAAALVILAVAKKGVAGAYRVEDTVLRIDRYDYSEEAAPEHLGVHKFYSFTIPKVAARGQQLCFYVKHQYVSVDTAEDAAYINSEMPKPHIGHTPGHYWVCIPIRQQDAGNPVTVRLTPVYDDFQPEEMEFFIGSKYNVLEIILKREFFVFAVSVLTIATGGLLCVFAFLAHFSSRDTLRMLYLGLLTLAVGLWKLTGISFMYMLYAGSGRTLYYLGIVALALLPVFCMRFLHFQAAVELSSLSAGLSAASFCFTLLTLLLQLLGLRELHDFAFFYVAETTILLFLLTGWMMRQKAGTRWVLPFPLAALADLLIIRFTGTAEPAVCLLLWVFLNAMMRGGIFIREDMARERRLRKQAEELQDARITALMNQIRPHFIHNTLASIYYLCEDDPAKAQSVINDFMYYLQNNYNAITSRTPVPFEEELKHVQAYVAVEQVRFEGELSIEYRADHTDFRIPALTIQPLVENSVKYGIGSGVSPEHILLQTRKLPGGSEIVIEDDGMGFDPKNMDKGPHTGIENVRRRLELMCRGTLTIESTPGRGTKCTIFIPSE